MVLNHYTGVSISCPPEVRIQFHFDETSTAFCVIAQGSKEVLRTWPMRGGCYACSVLTQQVYYSQENLDG
jgi:hypothetical protein